MGGNETLNGRVLTVLRRLFAAALTHFPALSDWINGWFEPVLRAMR